MINTYVAGDGQHGIATRLRKANQCARTFLHLHLVGPGAFA